MQRFPDVVQKIAKYDNSIMNKLNMKLVILDKENYVYDLSELDQSTLFSRIKIRIGQLTNMHQRYRF